MIGPVFAPTVSVIVLNRDRPHLMRRVLLGLSQLDYPDFEVIIVGDRAHATDYDLPGKLADDIRYFHCAEANISRARNIGVRAARGAIVAFCDDDAVPEPDWLRELILPFAAPEVGGVGGLVRGEDGIAVQWCGAICDRTGGERPLIGRERHARVFERCPNQQEFAGLMGVNTAFRRRALLEIGGFDECYRYYLDETDVALRLSEAGWNIALAPSAEVHHFHETNVARGSLRRPRNFHQIGASKAYFCKTHTPPQWLEETLTTFITQKRVEMDPYIRMGLLDRAARDRLEQQLIDGFVDGLDRQQSRPLGTDDRAFGNFEAFRSRLEGGALSIAMIAGWGLRNGARMRRLARRIAAGGHRVSLFNFRTGSHPRRVQFDNGVWLHSGGTWRLDHRVDGQLLLGRTARSKAELERVLPRRQFDLIVARRGARLGLPERAVLAAPELPVPLAVHSATAREEDLPRLIRRLAEAMSDRGHAPAANLLPPNRQSSADGTDGTPA